MSSEDKAGSTAALKNKLKKDKDMSHAEDEEHSEEALLTSASVAELEQKLNEAEAKANENWERALRIQADMDNMRRRVERDVESAHKYALEKFVLELLPIVDSLERAIGSHNSEDSSAGSLLDGVSLTLKMFTSAWEKFGVQQINPEGQAFNPEWHQAVSTQVDPNVKPGTVLTVLQKGYLLNNRLIRPALVVVSKAS